MCSNTFYGGKKVVAGSGEKTWIGIRYNSDILEQLLRIFESNYRQSRVSESPVGHGKENWHNFQDFSNSAPKLMFHKKC